LHAVALYQRAGEELLSAAETNEDVRGKVVNILSERMAPAIVAHVEDKLSQGEANRALMLVTPGDLFRLTAEYRTRYPQDGKVWGSAGKELEQLNQTDPTDTNWQQISRDFGIPHPRLAQTYERQLLGVEPFPAFAGYSSRLMAESWESNNLYWARLADEVGYPPVMLNILAPQLTRRMVEKIFATDFEDWPALLRAMHEAGNDFRSGKMAVIPVPTEGNRASAE
jgi:hypothetical protein